MGDAINQIIERGNRTCDDVIEAHRRVAQIKEDCADMLKILEQHKSAQKKTMFACQGLGNNIEYAEIRAAAAKKIAKDHGKQFPRLKDEYVELDTRATELKALACRAQQDLFAADGRVRHAYQRYKRSKDSLKRATLELRAREEAAAKVLRESQRTRR